MTTNEELIKMIKHNLYEIKKYSHKCGLIMPLVNVILNHVNLLEKQLTGDITNESK